ncbi:MAG: RsmD family RNA methyltransferase [bacterium]
MKHTTRILGGTLKFRVLEQPGEGTRPVSQKIRQAIFDTLGHDLSGLVVADLYAGSGALGFEALSCGATKVVFVERARIAAQGIIKASKEFGVDEEIQVITGSVENSFTVITGSNIIFFDPPYDACDMTLAAQAADSLAKDGVLVLSCSSRQKLPETLGNASIVKDRTYGSTKIAYYKS